MLPSSLLRHAFSAMFRIVLIWSIYRTGLWGFGVSRVADLANFSPQVPGFTLKSCGFSGLDISVTGCGFGHFLCSGFGYFTQNSYFVGFRDSRLGTGSVDGPSILMEGVRGEHEHHNQKKNDEEEDKGWFAISLLQLVQPYAATCGQTTCFAPRSFFPHTPLEMNAIRR